MTWFILQKEEKLRPLKVIRYRYSLPYIAGLEKFYQKYLPFVTRQPRHRQEVAPSVFETNLSVTSEQAERENEWNTKGLGSNLNPMVRYL